MDESILNEQIQTGAAMKSFIAGPNWAKIKESIQLKVDILNIRWATAKMAEIPQLQVQAQAYRMILTLPQSLISDGESAKETLEVGEEGDED